MKHSKALNFWLKTGTLTPQIPNLHRLYHTRSVPFFFLPVYCFRFCLRWVYRNRIYLFLWRFHLVQSHPLPARTFWCIHFKSFRDRTGYFFMITINFNDNPPSVSRITEKIPKQGTSSLLHIYTRGKGVLVICGSSVVRLSSTYQMGWGRHNQPKRVYHQTKMRRRMV